MSYLTLEVQIDHGKVIASEPSKLPEKASGLLTILLPDEAAQETLNPLEALDALQRHLKLNPQAAANWMASVREARR